ncbi:MAG: glycosyltransferase [bacterium]|nr:glycosyltransferase [bacterium]
MTGNVEQVTYLVANYNCAVYLEECLGSVLAQHDGSWRCIVADDASTDSSMEVIEPFLGEKLSLLRNETNLGYIATLKKLIAAAETDIVAILDADDALHAEATGAVLNAYAENPETGLVYTRHCCFSEDGSPIRCRGGESRGVPPTKTSLEFGFISHLKTFRKSRYFRTRGLDETILYAEDRDLGYKLEEVTKPVFIDQPLYFYRLTTNSQSHDPHKLEIGARNHIVAKRQALDRRRIHGRFERAFYELSFWLEYAKYSARYGPFGRFGANRLWSLLQFLDLLLRIRSVGRLRREAAEVSA